MSVTTTYRPAVEAAKDYLQRNLLEPTLAEDVLESASKQGHKESSLKKAKRELGIYSRKLGTTGTQWLWIPEQHQTLAEKAAVKIKSTRKETL